MRAVVLQGLPYAAGTRGRAARGRVEMEKVRDKWYGGCSVLTKGYGR